MNHFVEVDIFPAIFEGHLGGSRRDCDLELFATPRVDFMFFECVVVC
jgi:hypothetical protein